MSADIERENAVIEAVIVLQRKLDTMTADRDAEKSMKATARFQRNKMARMYDELKAKKICDQNGEVFELDQWWVSELEDASITKIVSADLVRACKVAGNLARAVLEKKE
jgi:hypothetical protein